ncbi:mevalonate kinase [Candidatus Microgenomates bacterium]|nr:mevalonate kinase [Candidatus Microgenomates bacterium]
MRIRVSASGKLMLLGEHAVVYNRPCLVTAVNQRMRAWASVLDELVLVIEAEDVGVSGYKKSIKELGKGKIPQEAKFVEISVRNFIKKYAINKGVFVKTKSEFSSRVGFGSSAASAVCTVKALSELFNVKLSLKEIFDICYKTVLDIQGKGSGFDVAAAVYGGTLYYLTGGKIIKPLVIKKLPLVIGYTGFKASTSELIKLVAQKAEKYPQVIENIYDEIEKLVKTAKKALIKKDWSRFGQLMDFNQGYLESLGVGSRKLANMIYGARKAGALGAKLSGAGVGDCMISLVDEKNRAGVEKAIEEAGGEIIKLDFNAEGVRVE